MTNIGNVKKKHSYIYHKQFVYALYTFYVRFIYTLYTFYVRFIYTLYTFYVHFMYTFCTLYIHLMYTLCTLYIHFMYALLTLVRLIKNKFKSSIYFTCNALIQYKSKHLTFVIWQFQLYIPVTLRCIKRSTANSWFWALSLNFVCADMFPYENSKIVFVCLSVPRERNHPIFVNISPTLVIDTSMEMSSRVLHHGSPKISFYFQKSSKLNFDLYFDMCRKTWNHPNFINIINAFLSVSAVMFYKQCLSYTVHIDRSAFLGNP